jgi:hypothetical protein
LGRTIYIKTKSHDLQASACKSWDFFLYHLKMLQRIHNGILFFLQTLGLFGILGFWLIVSLPLFFVNNKAADSLPLAESINGFHESSNPPDKKIGTRFSASADSVTL